MVFFMVLSSCFGGGVTRSCVVYIVTRSCVDVNGFAHILVLKIVHV
nr:MAG TPA: hypothetical protein [Caudoviricetes sp.]